jgi:crotonobetainyl-CoA:carnitine CoA-transferase CaiB-like acyl-CoA transferase
MKEKRKSLLQGIFVLDLADETGSFCSKLLADLGACVVKVERPQGDPLRKSGPIYRAKRDSTGISLSFFYHNTNKLGIVLDLESRKGKQYLHRLLESADVVVETLPRRSALILGLDRQQSHRINPRLIHISITGFGRTGPKSSFNSCDSVASACGGQMSLSGSPTSPPVKLSGNQSWYTASLFGANAVLLSLNRRRATGKGCYVDLSAQESVASTLDHVMIDFFHRGEIAGRKQDDPSSESFEMFPCRDGYIQIPTLRNWETLLQLMDSDGKAKDLLSKKWRREAYRKIHRSQIMEAIAEWTAGHMKRELFELGQGMQFPWAPICTLQEVLESPQLKARHFFVSVKLPGIERTVSLPGLPYKLKNFSPAVPMPAPLLGEHTAKVLEQLRFRSENETAAHRDAKQPRHSLSSGNILNDIRVVDFTRMLSGPYATRILADFGAEVIKVQSKSTAQGAESDDMPYFGAWNRNKRSVGLNLNHPEAHELILELIARSDIVVENFSPRVMANWELTYGRLSQLKPDLIMASISAMGHTGPWKNFVGFAPTFHALSGLISQSSRSYESPIDIGHSYGDVIAGLYAALAILASLEYRDRTGKGQYIDLSAYEAVCSLLGPALMEEHLALKQNVSRQRIIHHGADALCGCYPCSGNDSWCVIAIGNETQWRSLCRISGKPEIMSTKFSTKAGRKKNRPELNSVIAEWTICHSAKTIVRRLQREGIAAGVVQNAKDLAQDSQLAARRFFVSMEHSRLGTTYSDRSALWLWREKTANWKAAPQLGEDNHYVFVELLGRSEADFHALIRRGIIQ